MGERFRQHLGPSASGALPLLWAEIRRRELTHADVARELDDDAGKVAKLLYGERKPGRALALRLRDTFGTPIEAWDEPLPPGWLPHGTSDEPSSTQLSADDSGEHRAVSAPPARTSA